VNNKKRTQLQGVGFKVGSASEFLGLSEAEARYVDLKAGLSFTMAQRRHELSVTQQTLALQLESSQSRVAKMEAGDQSVSLDLLVRSLFAMGMSPKELADVVRNPALKPAKRVGPKGRKWESLQAQHGRTTRRSAKA